MREVEYPGEVPGMRHAAKGCCKFKPLHYHKMLSPTWSISRVRLAHRFSWGQWCMGDVCTGKWLYGVGPYLASGLCLISP